MTGPIFFEGIEGMPVLETRRTSLFFYDSNSHNALCLMAGNMPKLSLFLFLFCLYVARPEQFTVNVCLLLFLT